MFDSANITLSLHVVWFWLQGLCIVLLNNTVYFCAAAKIFISSSETSTSNPGCGIYSTQCNPYQIVFRPFKLSPLTSTQKFFVYLFFWHEKLSSQM
jgi:Ni,Fe-hydrogenase I cytochrome b subunit